MIIQPTTRQLRYFNLARLISFKSTHLTANVGSVIVNGNYVVSKSSNHSKGHTIQRRYDKRTNYYSTFANIHAEIGALIKSGRRDIIGCELYVYREDKHGNLASSCPCCSCTQAIKDAGIKHLYYTTKDGYHYERVG